MSSCRAAVWTVIRADKRSVWRDSNESRGFVPLLAHKHYIEFFFALSHIVLEENFIAIIIVIELSPSPISDYYLVLCKLHIAKAVNSTPWNKYCRAIPSTTKDCFASNLLDLSQFLSKSNSAEKLDVTETMDSLFSSTLDPVAPLSLRKIKEKSPTPWYNEHTRALKRAAWKMEWSWRKTKLEVFRISWQECTLSYRKKIKTDRSELLFISFMRTQI